MANPLAKRLIAIVAACVAAGSLSAQDDLFDQAVRKLRLNDREAALSLLTEYLASNPGNEDAFDLWTKTESDVWLMLRNEGGEFASIAKHLMTLATSGRREISRDADKIRELVEVATSAGDYSTRFRAMAELTSSHSEFAVPELVRVLGNPDEDTGQNYAMLTLQRIGSPAVLPLVETLSSDSDLLRRNVAATLVHIGDSRAAGPLAKLAAEDKNEAVREIARAGLEKFRIPAGSNAVEVFLKDAQAYLTGRGLRGLTPSEVVWTFEDGQLVAHDVPAEVFHLELAKKAAHTAMSMDPASDAAKTLLARSYLAEVAAIEESLAANPDNEALQGLSAKVPALRMVAMTTGPKTLRQALTDSLRDNMTPTAIAAIDALSDVETSATIGNSPLLTALNDSNSSAVGYAAALAITKVAGDSTTVPAAAKVVEVLGRAVSEKGRRLVKIIAADDRAKTVADNASASKSDIRVTHSGSANAGVQALMTEPDYDVYIVSDALQAEHPRTIISLVRKKSPNAKILLLTNNEDSASEKFGELVDGFIAEQLSPDLLSSKANEFVETLDARRAKANQTAIAASRALDKLAQKIDVSGAVASLEGQLNRDDAVAIPAANALGSGGNASSLKALGAALGGEGSLELKVAAARAMGMILGREASVPTECFDQMIAIASDKNADAGLRTAVVTALSSGSLAPGERLKLAETLRTIAVAGE